MNIIVGQVASKNDFWGRENEIANIWDALMSGSSVLLAAPRRVGKTSIMYKLRDEPQGNFIVLYSIVSSAHSTNAFWERLFRDISSTDFADTFGNKARHFFGLAKTIKIDSVSANGVKFGDSKVMSYLEAFKELILKMDESIKLIIMVDEFAQAIDNMVNKGDKGEAQLLLQDVRLLRQDDRFSSKVQFVFAGSIGLESVVVKADSSTKEINDLNSIPINPFNLQDAKKFALKLASDNAIAVADEQIDYTLAKLEWLIPFHIQIMMQELKRLRKIELSNDDVDEAFRQALKQRNHFEHWEKRFEPLKLNEHKFAKELLNKISENSTIASSEIMNLATKHELEEDEAKNIIRSLIYDGYINNDENPKIYRFNSAMLKMWWFQNVAN